MSGLHREGQTKDNQSEECRDPQTILTLLLRVTLEEEDWEVFMVMTKIKGC